jgi:hypothetical protein
MDSEKFKTILARLIELGDKGELDWKPTGVEYTYLLTLKDSSISISPEFSEDLGSSMYAFQFRNERGDVVENTYVGEDDADYGSAEYIYELARRKALNSDATIDRIIEQLKPDSLAA